MRRQRVLLGALTVIAFVILPVALFVSVPVAGYLLGSLLAVLAILRLILPVDVLGALVVRRRGIDVLITSVLAAGILVLASSPNL